MSNASTTSALQHRRDLREGIAVTTSYRAGLLMPALAAALVGCAAAPPPAHQAPAPGQEALIAYERYWSVAQEAFSAPGSRDWRGALEAVASGPALDSLLADVRNYASFPAHTEGVATRSPVVADIRDGRVQISDCITLGDSRLIADETGEVLDDLENRAPRYRFRADVVLTGDRWLVERTEPALAEPC